MSVTNSSENITQNHNFKSQGGSTVKVRELPKVHFVLLSSSLVSEGWASPAEYNTYPIFGYLLFFLHRCPNQQTAITSAVTKTQSLTGFPPETPSQLCLVERQDGSIMLGDCTLVLAEECECFSLCTEKICWFVDKQQFSFFSWWIWLWFNQKTGTWKNTGVHHILVKLDIQ